MQHKRHGPIVDLFNQQSGFCCYCGEKMTLKKGGRDMATVEHIVPKSYGGIDAPSNWAAAHAVCNWERGNTPLLIYLASIAQKVPLSPPVLG